MLRIKDLREDNDYTQQYIADYLHCDQSDYSKYERGKRNVYDTSIDYLACRTDESRPYPKSKKTVQR